MCGASGFANIPVVVQCGAPRTFTISPKGHSLLVRRRQRATETRARAGAGGVTGHRAGRGASGEKKPAWRGAKRAGKFRIRIGRPD
jgi:hypothetical protein